MLRCYIGTQRLGVRLAKPDVSKTSQNRRYATCEFPGQIGLT